MIIDYNLKYEESVKDLLVELQEHISDIDLEGYNRTTSEYRTKYFDKTMQEVKEYEGKILLYKEDEQIVGLVIGLINNEAEETYDFKAPRRGRITELVVSKNIRSKGIGTKLLNAMESYLNSQGCKDILLGVFGYNDKAIKFYEKNGYHTRMIEMTKTDIFSKENMEEYYDIEFAKDRLETFMKLGKEPELCIRIKGNNYMIIPLKNKISFQWMEHTDEFFYSSVDELFCSDLINGINLNRDWKLIERIEFY